MLARALGHYHHHQYPHSVVDDGEGPSAVVILPSRPNGVGGRRSSSSAGVGVRGAPFFDPSAAIASGTAVRVSLPSALGMGMIPSSRVNGASQKSPLFSQIHRRPIFSETASSVAGESPDDAEARQRRGILGNALRQQLTAATVNHGLHQRGELTSDQQPIASSAVGLQQPSAGSRVQSAKSTSGLTIVDSSDEEHRTGILGRSLAAGQSHMGQGSPAGQQFFHPKHTMLFGRKDHKLGDSLAATEHDPWRKRTVFYTSDKNF
jgi:hypothetical protein